jgi:nucleoside phosphorylase
MFYFIVALNSEARPIIDFYKLKKIENKPFLVYKNSSNMFLIISGVGHEKALISTTFLLAKYPPENINSAFLLNIGISGATDNVNISDIFLANQIIDYESKKSFYPDMSFKFDISELSLFSVQKPQIGNIENSNKAKYLVDMESASIFKAGSYFLPTSSLIFIKIVSDNLKSDEILQINNKKIELLISKNITKIERIIDVLSSIIKQNILNIAIFDDEYFEKNLSLNLTLSERKILTDAIMFYRLKNKQNFDFNNLNLSLKNKLTKNEKKEVFNQILESIYVLS